MRAKIFRWFPLIVLLVATGKLLSSGWNKTILQQQEQKEQGDKHETAHHTFDDVTKWVEIFENPERDEWQKPQEVLDALDLKGNEIVVDIGAATGYFPVRFARALPEGRVYGADVEQEMVHYLNDRAKREGFSNLNGIVAEPDDPGIPEPVDLVFLCDTYHHIGDRKNYFERLKKHFKPGGRLVIIDFMKGDLPVGPPDHMKLHLHEVTSELSQAGYRLVQHSEILPYQYFLIFEPSR